MQRPQPRRHLQWRGPCFNPHPARRPDATNRVAVVPNADSRVSILIRPEGRMQRGLQPRQVAVVPGFNPHPARRPDATGTSAPAGGCGSWFQSSSGQKAGCNLMSASSWLSHREFQSSSGQKAGCNPFVPGDGRGDVGVSILIRPEGRMQPWITRTSWSSSECFNPHPARRPDATPYAAKRLTNT